MASKKKDIYLPSMKYLVFCVLSILFFSLYLYSCANRTIPTGGPKDTIPPTLIKVKPENKSLNFDGDEIVLTFDEFIKTKDINSQLIITPRIDEENFYKVNKQTLTIELNQKLDSNTTYTFNFQESVQDITESTPARDLVIAFSTGSYIDSLSIFGTVVDLLSNKPVKNAVVALYEANDTLDLFNSKPQYFTRTKDDGTYRIENLKADTFKIYAFADPNKNLTNQSDSEPYGFVAEPIILDSMNTPIDIPIIKRNIKEFLVQSTRPNGKYYEIKLNKYIEDYTLRSLEETGDSLVSNPIIDQNVIRIYNTISTDSLLTEVTAIDTIGQKLVDTVAIKFPPTQRASDPISSAVSPKSNQAVEENFKAEITFNKPTYLNSLDSAFIYYDSLLIDPIRGEELTWNNYHNILTINKRLDRAALDRLKVVKDSIALAVKNRQAESLADSTVVETLADTQSEVATEQEPNNRGGRLRRQNEEKAPPKPKNKFAKSDAQFILFFGRNTFISIENDTIPEILSTYSFKNTKDTGIIKGKIITDKEAFTIQLLDKSLKPLNEIKNSRNFNFSLIPPGEYVLRILIDNDGNGTWDPGNILENKEPEDAFFYKEPVIIRANWERELDDIEF